MCSSDLICEDFALGAVPTSGCGWSIYATSGSGWVFTGNPGYNASTTMGNNNTAGEFAWIDFSSTDVSPTLEMTSVNVSGLFSPTLSFDYFSDLGTYVCAPSNIMYVETWRSEEQRLNSSHKPISYAVFCLKKKTIY